MACSHRVTGKTPCLECFYEALGHDDSAVQRLSATVLGSEGRALCLGSRLLWRTSFLKRCTDDFLASAHSSAAPQLINMLTRMVAEECLGQASVSCSVERHAAVGGMLLEALVAHVAQHCTQKAPGLAQLFQLLESILEAFGAAPAALDTLSRTIESSSPVLAALVSVPDDGSGGGLLLRLAERGGKELSPHLARESRRLAHSLAEAQPGSQLATTLLALYRMCALHPELFESLLSGDLTAHAAESRHDGRLQGLPELDLLIRAAELLGRGSLRKAELVRALAAALWPALELGASFSEEQAAAFIKCCLQLDYLVPKLMDNEVLLAEDGPEGAAEELAAGQLMAVLLIPFLSVDAVSLQPLVPPSELQRLCSALLRSEDAWLARAAAAAAAETDLEEAELDRLAMGLPPLPLRAVVLLTCAVGRCAQKAAGFACGFAGEKLALAWGPLLAETRRSMAEPNAQEEWRLLKNLLPNGRNQLITALGWLLASAEEAEDAKDILLRAIELECASPEKEDWRWLSNCLPSPLWMAQRLEVLLGHALEDPAAGCGMLALITLCLADVKAAAVIVSSHAVAGIAMKWQRSASQPGDARLIEGIGLFMLQQLAAAPAGALQHSPVLAILLETLQSPSGCCLLPELAALAHFRAWDVPRLRELDLGGS
ncbi:unnamed protein product [Effrenium voratum]|nr:unnamed protein product [Effrenium voratum]